MHAVQDHYADPVLDSMVSHEILIDNRSNSNELDNYPVDLAIDRRQLSFDAEDCLRFVDENLRILAHWNESFPDTEWLKMTKIPGNAMCALRMLEGAPSLNSVSDGVATFDLFDDSFNTLMFAAGENTIFSGNHEGETSVVVEGDTAHCWTGAGSNHQSLEYSYASDSKCAVYTQYGGNPVKTNIRFPDVIKVGSTYYLFAHDTTIDGLVGDVYLWSSTNKTTWNIMNNGNPVLEHSAVTTDWNYKIANVSVCVVDGVWHMLVEASTDAVPYWKGWYTYSNLIDLNWTTNMVIISDLMSCPSLVHVPDRNALLNFGPTGNATLQSKAYYASLSDDLTVPANWHQGIFDLGADVADAELAVIGPGKDHNIIFQYYKQASNNYQKYIDFSLNEIYDAISGTQKWTTSGIVTVNDKIAKMSAGGYIKSVSNFDNTHSIRVKVTNQSAATAASGLVSWFGSDKYDYVIYGNWPTADVLNGFRTGSGLSSFSLGHNGAATYLYELQRSGTQVTVYEYQTGSPVLKGTIAGGISADANIYFGGDGVDSAISVDWVLVRKYSSPEPRTKIGAI